jgi:hypothetical protein
MGQLLGRRKIVMGAVGVAGAGATGAVLTETAASALAADTTVGSGAVAPAVVHLTDAATIAVDASLGNDFRVTVAGNRTMGTPASPENGQQVIFQVTQGSGGSFTLSWDSGYEFSSGLPQPVLSTGAGQTDLLGFVYNGSMGTWLLVAFVNGFDAEDAVPPTQAPSGAANVNSGAFLTFFP